MFLFFNRCFLIVFRVPSFVKKFPFFPLKTLLHWCVRYGNYPGLLATIDRGADVNLTDSAQRTPLYFAILDGSLHIASTLLKARANPNIHDLTGVVHFFTKRSTFSGDPTE
jgi:ankyrin repeat protein